MRVLQELLGAVPVGEFLQRNFAQLPFAMPDRAAPYQQQFTGTRSQGFNPYERNCTA